MLLSLLTGVLLGGCGSGDTCATARNGTCEELVGCPLGTDSTDCDQACAKGPWTSGVEGACAHDRAGDPTPEVEEAAGSWGSGGLVGTWDGTVTVRGTYRTDEVDRHYRVYVPRSYDPQVPTPLLFVLGGFTVDLYYLADFTELNGTADLNDFIVVYGQPEWRDFGSYDVFAWYVYDSAWQGEWEENPDLEYLEAVFQDVSALYNVDRTRVFASGHSRGAALSLIAAFERPGRFAGFCAEAGFVTSNDYDYRMEELAPERRTGAYLVHGIDDPDVGVQHSDSIQEVLESLGWVEDEDYHYERLDWVTHAWQPQLNQQVWDFLADHPLPVDEVDP